MSFIDMNSIINFIVDIFTSKMVIIGLVLATTNVLFGIFFGDLTSTCQKCGATYKEKNYYKIRGAVGIWMGLVIAVPHSRGSFEYLMGVALILLGIFFQFKKVAPHVCSFDELDMEAAKSDSTN